MIKRVLAGLGKDGSFAVVRRLPGLLQGSWARLSLFAGLLVLAAASGVAVPLIIRRLIDQGLRLHDVSRTVELGIAALAVSMLAAGASAAGNWLGAAVGMQLIFDLRMRLYRHLQTLPLAFYSRSQSGAVLTRLTNDVVGAQGLIQGLLGQVASNAVTLVAAAAAMASLSSPITVCVFGVAPALLLPVRHFGRHGRVLSRRQAQARSAAQAYLTERLNVGGALLRILFGHRKRDAAAYREHAAAMRDTVLARNANFYRSSFLLAALGAVGYCAVFVLGGVPAFSGTMSVGTVVALAALVKVAYDPLISFATAGINFYSGLVSFERVFDILDYPAAVAEPPITAHVRRPARRLEFRHVSFRHPRADEATLPSLIADHGPTDENSPAGAWALTDISFAAVPGGVTAVVGPTGAGKTTLALLAAHLYDPQEGSVLIEGVDVRDIALEELHAMIGMVTQDAYLFNDTLAGNLRLAAPDATVEQLKDSCRQACLDDLLARLPDGLDTLMGDRGYRLSGGERQRVALARAFLAQNDIVILDEATAHLDSRTEAAIQTAFDAVLADRTMIVIAHRITTIVNADLILVMDRGKIIESGTHRELLVTGTMYPRLYAASRPGSGT